MDSDQKLGSSNCSESSSEELEQSEATLKEEDDDDHNYSHNFNNIVIKRSYECIFCKRGFTNAQALGGHMNIHRKDRPNKSPKIISSSSSSLQSNQIFGQSTFNNIPYFGSLLGKSQVNYQASPSNLHGYFQEVRDFNMNLWGSDLSLQIGPANRRRRLWNGDGIDLELRLGHHHP